MEYCSTHSKKTIAKVTKQKKGLNSLGLANVTTGSADMQQVVNLKIESFAICIKVDNVGNKGA